MRLSMGFLAMVGLVAGALLAVVPGAGAQDAGDDPALVGAFSEPFVEPTISDATGYPRVTTDEKCIERPGSGNAGRQGGLLQGFIDCKPTAGGLTTLPNGKNLYWDNLAGTENVEVSILSEYGVVGLNDQTRVLDTKTKTWTEPTPVDGGAVSQAPIEPITIEALRSQQTDNDGALFCADGNFLADGTFMATGGTKYENDPGNDALKFGATELLGIENARIYDPETNRWTQTGSMHKPRWYPTLLTLPDGKQFVASGLRRLVKPVNTTDPIDPSQVASGLGLQEGQNERVTETYNPDTGQWSLNGDSARRSLPLFARLHLLPNGHVYYNAAGQAFNPLGQAYDMALWNIAASYDPETTSWKDLGVPGQGVSPVPGFRGSTFSVMLPLKPNADGSYTKASFLTGGGVTGGIAAPSPGTYVALRDSFITTVDTAKGNELSAEDAGDMNPSSTPATGRWYGSGTLLPTGHVLATSGADRDEVAVPGLESPVTTAELFDPETKKWEPVASQHRPRTYHNTAVLLPDARVLVGGHAPISNSYLSNLTLPGGVTAPNDGRDPTFEIYSPPYMSCAGSQATIESVRGSAETLTLGLDVPADEIDSVVLVRNPSVTHVTDADQRTVQLRIVSRSGNTLTVAQAPNGNVAPPGPYMLFVNRKVGGCVKPSHAAQVSAALGGKVKPLAGCLARRSPIGPRNVGRVRLGTTRAGLLASRRLAPVGPLSRTASRYSYCVKRSRGRVTAVFGRHDKVSLVTTTAKRHGNRGIRPGASLAKMLGAFPRAVRIGPGLYRSSARSRRLIGVRGGKVRFWGVADGRLLRPGNLQALKTSLRRAGV